MERDDFVYQRAYKGCLNANVPQGIAANTAAKVLENYKKGRLGGGCISNDCSGSETSEEVLKEVVVAVTNKSTTQINSRDLWETDQRVVRWLENYLGFKFDLDVCCSPWNKKAPKGCTNDPRFRHDKDALERLGVYWDGLVQPWHRIGKYGFGNPPFSKKELWFEKAEREARKGMTAVKVAPVAMATSWWIDMENGSERILQPDKRINYINPMTGKIIKGVSFETAFAIFRPKKDVIIERVRVEL